jgi:hypothetical protein
MTSAVTFTATILAERLPVADCEALHDGLVRQPANAYSSLAFLAVGLWILFRAVRLHAGARAELAAFGVGIAGVGVGSFVLHGPAPGWALWFHDLTGLAVLLLVVILDLGLLLGWSFRRRLLLFAAGLVPLALLLAALPTSTVSIAYVLAPTAGIVEVAVIRAGLRPGPSLDRSVRDVAWLVAAVALALAGGVFLLGRSGSPLCHPDSLLQLHAVWHVLVAVAAGAFAFAAMEHGLAPEEPEPGR